MSKYKTLRLILGDQLNEQHSWYNSVDDTCCYVIAELRQEASYVAHHVQKLLAFFAAMSSFANILEQRGHKVIHLTLDQTEQYRDLPQLLSDLLDRYQISCFQYQQPDEYRLSQQLAKFSSHLESKDVSHQCFETEHFYLEHSSLPKYFKKSTGHRLESFYRKLRKQFDILLIDGEPAGGKWNYDINNRKKLKKTELGEIPEPLIFDNDYNEINDRLERHKVVSIGHSHDKLLWPVTRQQSLELLNFFCAKMLPNFGNFQDAMTCQADDLTTKKQWSLYHSRLSFSLNSKLLSPVEVVATAIDYYRKNPALISIEQIEGFVRQILGWREFVRGIYWLNMPDYAELNQLEAERPLPEWFWSANTKMNCLHHAIKQSLEYAYAHHIQRLMVTGNFCLIAGIDPKQVDDWYLGIYVDAIEWVEMPNTRGMSQFADGGIVGSKAYAASGNYINKMSDYCSSCHYSVKETTAENACPLNSLYWHFMHKHQARFNHNPRNKMVYANWNKRDESVKQAILAKAQSLLIDIENI
ncbi:MAG: cryptochrome/photolyase family protein [Kangiellaceae bacterium]|jgi:deoxyribodipyrimidine photolyase-related protein|nr:cryptochrome/photolyase family protein [Kangiellaceae bacterium]